MQGYHGFGLEELLHGQKVGCSENASTVLNAATPTRTTTQGPSQFLFINRYGVFTAQSLTGYQYPFMVRTGDGRLAMPGAMPQTPGQ